MLKKIAAVAAAAALALTMAGCSAGGSGGQTAQEEKAPLSLDGKWKQVNSADDETWMAAEIEDDVIAVDWVSDNGDTKSVYWVGSYEQPNTTEDAYDFTSIRDAEATDTALMASTADDKDFSYKNGVLSFELTALGTTTVVKMELE